jgi:hypothetical protein
MRNLKKVFITAVLAAFSILPSFGQNTPAPAEEKPKTHFVHKGMIWAQHAVDFNTADPTLAFVNVFKDKRHKGFGVQTLVATKPLHIGTDKPVTPVLGIGPHWGKRGGNINALATFNPKQGQHSGYLLLMNKRLSEIFSARSITAFGTDFGFKKTEAHLVAKLANKFLVNGGAEVNAAGDITPRVGVAYTY